MAFHAALLVGARAVLSGAARADEPEAPEVVLRLDLRRASARPEPPLERALVREGGAPFVARDEIPTPTESELLTLPGPDLDALRAREDAAREADEAPLVAWAPTAAPPAHVLARRGGVRRPRGASPVGGPTGAGSPDGAGAGPGGPPGAGSGTGTTGLGDGAGPGAAAALAPPRLLAAPPPPYPERARRGGIEGDVVCRLWLGATGTVEDVEVVTSSGHEDLDRAACAALRGWRFAPGARDGRSIACQVVHTVSFRLR